MNDSQFSDYPASHTDRDAWILSRRPNLDARRDALPTDRPASFLVEEEPDAAGRVVRSLTIFLTNRECPWRCLMCDLWRHTTRATVPVVAIPAQIEAALNDAGSEFSQLKLYNAGSFFDAGAIPTGDHAAIAEQCRRFPRVVVECHPRLVGDRMLPFRDLLGETRLEVAMGLETAHPEVLAKLNKRMTTDDFARAADLLSRNGVDLRVFVLVKPPFLTDAEALEWSLRSVEFAFDCGAKVVSLIPTRAGNGALDELSRAGLFSPPTLSLFEDAVDHAFASRRGRVFADVWELDRFNNDPTRFSARHDRLVEMNRRQIILPHVRG